jgi:hypothetical protein
MASQLPRDRASRIGSIRTEVSGFYGVVEVAPQLRIYAGDLADGQPEGSRDIDACLFGNRGGNARATVAAERAA